MDARISVPTPQRIATNQKQTIARICELVKLWTPKDTGKLLDSFYMRGNTLGYTAPYATYVHENTNALHKAPTCYKFLEDAAIMAANECSFIGRIGITYEPLAVYMGTSTGATIYERE